MSVYAVFAGIAVMKVVSAFVDVNTAAIDPGITVRTGVFNVIHLSEAIWTNAAFVIDDTSSHHLIVRSRFYKRIQSPVRYCCSLL